MENLQEQELIFGLMENAMMVSGLMASSMDQVCGVGKGVIHTKANGGSVNLKVMVFTHFQMEILTRDSLNSV